MRIYQLKGRIKPNRCLAKGANFFEGLQEKANVLSNKCVADGVLRKTNVKGHLNDNLKLITDCRA